MKSKIWPSALRVAIAVAVIGFGYLLYQYLLSSKPPASFRAPPRRDPIIEVIQPNLQDYTVLLRSQGEVRARTRSVLVPEVNGRVIEVSANFTEGAFFEAGEVLLRLDPRNYEVALASSQADVAQMEVTLAEEEALARQAADEWERLNPELAATSLVLREPQLKRAKANLNAAKARESQAALNLERTQIKAPYAGRVLVQSVDLGQFVGNGTQLGSIYAVDSAEIRLPLTGRQLTKVILPDLRRDGASIGSKLPVTVSSELSGKLQSWHGHIVRSEGAIDSASRQLFVIAEIDDPYGPAHNAPIKVGMFVEAEIQGGQLEDVWVLPAETLREGRYVIEVQSDNTIQRKSVEVLWSDDSHIVLPGETFSEPPTICKTPLNFAVNGMRVMIKGQGGAPKNRPADSPAEAGPSAAPTTIQPAPSKAAS